MLRKYKIENQQQEGLYPMTLSHTSLVTVDTYLYWAVQRLVPSLGTHREGSSKETKLPKG